MHNRLNGEHAKNFKASLGKALRFNKKFVLPIIIALILSFASSILAIIGPDKLKEITDIITKGIGSSIDMEAIKHISLILVIMYALSFIFNYLQGYIMAVVTNIFSKDMRMTISEKINKLPLSYFDKVTVGDVLSRVTNDVDTIGFTLNQSLGTLVSAATMFIGSLFMMFTTSYLLALVAIFSTVFGFVLMGVIMKKSQKYFYSVQKGLGNIDGYIEEMFNGHNIVKVYNAEEDTNKEFDQINEKLWKDSLKSQFYSGLMHPIMHFTGNFGYVMVCVVGAILTMKGTITFGVIVAFMIYIRLFTNPLSQFASSMTQLQATAAASERVFEFLEEKEMSEEKDFVKLRKKDVVGDLEFKNIKFGYGKKTIIKGFNAKVKAAQKIAIVGPTGAGKTTIVNLLMKFYNPNSGDIIIDGVPISKITRENVHELFTMVLQDTWLFKGTIKENIRYNNTSISDKEIYDICKKIGLDHFI